MNEKGYILPFVLVICTLVFFLLSHQVAMYRTDVRFYKESIQLNYMETLMQKSIVEVKHLVEIGDFSNKTLLFEEGKGMIYFANNNPTNTQKQITVTVSTDQKRKASVILYYDVMERKLMRWIEVR